MKKEKARLIKKQGSDVTIKRFVGPFSPALESETKAIIGRNTLASDMKGLENLRRGVFYPDADIDGGDFVYNPTLSESYVVSGTFPEPYRNQKIANIATLLKCNHLLTVKSSVQVADTRGNLKYELSETYTHVPCYVEQVTNELKQFDPGILAETEYKVSTAALDVKETDQVVLTVMGKAQTFKIVARDYVTFPRMLVLQVKRDVRK